MTEMMQPTRVVDDIRTFFDATQADPQAIRAVLPAGIRLLAEGRPVSPAEIGAAANLPLARVRTALGDLGDVEWTSDGRVEGMGLTPRETPHRIRIEAPPSRSSSSRRISRRSSFPRPGSAAIRAKSSAFPWTAQCGTTIAASPVLEAM